MPGPLMHSDIAILEARLAAAHRELRALDRSVSQLGLDISEVVHDERVKPIIAEWRKLTQALANLTLAADELLWMTRRS